MNIHIISPLLYVGFVKLIQYIKPCPTSEVMLKYRLCHNIFLSILSLFMLLGITYGNFITNKLSSLENLLCLPYDNDLVSVLSVWTFLYSKYLEWGDTLFLHLSGKKISYLQYTHHMTTAILMYSNLADYISPHIYIFMSLNCFVHIFMYWYFAYPKGMLYKIRKLITQMQIVQHVICILTIVYTMRLDNCEQNKYGNKLGLLMYLMYLFYFIVFYINSYRDKKLKR